MKPFNCVQKKKKELRFVEKCYLQNVFRNYIFNIYLQKTTNPDSIYLIYIYKKDLALNRQQELICHKTKLN